MKNIMRNRLVRIAVAGGLAAGLSLVAVNSTAASAGASKTTGTAIGTADASGAVSVTVDGAGTAGTSTTTVAGQIQPNAGVGSFKAVVHGTTSNGTFDIPFTTLGKTATLGSVSGSVSGSGGTPVVSNLTISIKCWVKYPPLSAGCTVIVSLA